MDTENRTDLPIEGQLVCLQTLSSLLLNSISNFQTIINQIQRRRVMLFRYLLKRRSLRLHYFRLTSSTVAAVLRRTHSRKRRIWMKDRVRSWWDNELSSQDWIQHFRMTEKTFDKLCDILKSDLKPQTLTVREPIPLRKRIAIALYKVGTCADYQTVARKFGVHKSSVHNCLYKFCEALVKHMDTFIKLPDQSELKLLTETTDTKFGLSNTWCIVDLTHVPIVCPVEESKNYMNSKGWQSYILQAVVDSNYLFRRINCNVPGGEEQTAFQASNLYPELENVHSDDETNSFYAVGNASHPLCPKLMKEFTSNVAHQSKAERKFSKQVNFFRCKLQRAFSLLKSRWRISLGRIDVDYTFAPTLIAVCCILHNFCIMENDEFNQSWSVGVEEMESNYPQPKPKPNNQEIGDAAIIRNNLVKNMI